MFARHPALEESLIAPVPGWFAALPSRVALTFLTADRLGGLFLEPVAPTAAAQAILPICPAAVISSAGFRLDWTSRVCGPKGEMKPSVQLPPLTPGCLTQLPRRAPSPGPGDEARPAHLCARFLTTMAEQLEGEHGPDGRAWLREHHPHLEGLLSEFTGR